MMQFGSVGGSRRIERLLMTTVVGLVILSVGQATGSALNDH
jgi:glycerol uptake facilitator-like aquaporin